MNDGVARVRWGVAALHGVVAMLIVIAVTVVLAVALQVADPERFGEGAGRLSLFFGLGALGASWLSQMQWKRAAIAVRLVLVALLLGVVALVLVADARAAEPTPHPSAAASR